MENQVAKLLNEITSFFPNVSYEMADNQLSSSLKHFVIKDKFSRGFGASHSLETAIQKAYSEFIERRAHTFLFKSYGDFENSNGFAAHLDEEKAVESSVNELIERDVFLSNWHVKKAPYWLGVENELKFLTPENQELYFAHLRHNLEIKLGIAGTCGELFIAIIVIKGKGNNSFYVDSKAGRDLFSLFNSLIESLAFYSHYILKPKFKIRDVKSFQEPMDHFFYYAKSRKGLDWFFQGNENVMDFFRPEISSYLLPIEDMLDNKKIKRCVAYSASLELQNYYCGKPIAKNINTKRLSNLFIGPIKINQQVHPLS